MKSWGSHGKAYKCIDTAVKAAALSVALYFGGRGLWLLQRALLSDQFMHALRVNDWYFA